MENTRSLYWLLELYLGAAIWGVYVLLIPFSSLLAFFLSSLSLGVLLCAAAGAETEKSTVGEGGEVQILFQNKRPKFKKLMKQ